MENVLHTLLYAVITAAVPVLTAFLVRYLAGLFTKVKTETESYVINDTINEVLDLVLRVVSSTSQTYVDSLKASGEFTEEQHKIAFDKTKTTIMNLLSEESKDLLIALYSDLDEWLTIQIESTVKQLKNN